MSRQSSPTEDPRAAPAGGPRGIGQVPGPSGYGRELDEHHLDFTDAQFEWRRLFAEELGTLFLVLVAVGDPRGRHTGGSQRPSSRHVVRPRSTRLTTTRSRRRP
jgi:hypothetical protein